MATLYGTQYADAYVEVPLTKIPASDFNAKEQVIYFDYAITAVPTAADIIKLAKIPKGARITDAILSFPDLGTTGVLELGWAASLELADGVTVEAASASGLLASVDVNAAAVGAINMVPKSGAAVAGFLKKFSGECDLQITVTTAWTVTSGTIKGVIKYVAG